MLDQIIGSFSDVSALGKVMEIIALNVVLSGDNALVIALACRALPDHQRRLGIMLGAGVAVLLRIGFTVIIASLLGTPFLRMAGALLLFWIAVKLVIEDADETAGSIAANDRLFKAVQTIAVADVVMSLDNVLAIAAVAKDSIGLLVLGLALSIPLIVAGASLITMLLERFPVLVWAGAGLLGWVAGDMFASDPWLITRLGGETMHRLEYPASMLGAALVLGIAALIKRRHALAGRHDPNQAS